LIGCRDYQLLYALVELLGEHLDAVSVLLEFLGGLHWRPVSSRGHRAAQRIEREVRDPQCFESRWVNNGQSADLHRPFGVERRSPELRRGGSYDIHDRRDLRGPFAPADLFDLVGQDRPRFEFAQHQLVCRGDNLADGLALWRPIGVERAPTLTRQRHRIRGRSAEKTAAEVGQNCREPRCRHNREVSLHVGAVPRAASRHTNDTKVHMEHDKH
jgi:hypothetical protein